jgi:outer membrane protein assembly factor BamB
VLEGQPWLLEDGITTAPPPAFLLHTGDVAEYGLPGDTEKAVEVFHEGISLPRLWVPGNHDHTWVVRPEVFERHSRGLRFHETTQGVHLLGVNSATMHEAVQSFGEEDVAFVREAAARIPANEPVLLAFHHPPGHPLWASEYDWARLVEPLRDRNLIALMVGHLHVVRHERIGGLSLVHGGSTFNRQNDPRPVDGFNLVHLNETTMTVVYRYETTTMPAVRQFERSLMPRASDEPGRVGPVTAQVIGSLLHLRWSGTPGKTLLLTTGSGASSRTLDATRHSVRIPLESHGNGVWWGKLTASADGSTVTSERTFQYLVNAPDKPGEGLHLWATPVGGGVKATPALAGDRLIVASNNRRLTAINRISGKVLWQVDTPGEVLGQPLVVGDEVIAGTLQGRLVSWDLASGAVRRQVVVGDGRGLVTPPLQDGERLLLGGVDGLLHGLGLKDFALQWTATSPTQALETAPFPTGNLLIQTTWDGWIYGLSRSDGRTVWRKPTPFNQKRVNRYYGAADSRVVQAGGRLWVTDRGYIAGSYRPENGEYLGNLATGITALALTSDGEGLSVRRLQGGLARLDLRGREVWQSQYGGGRIPTRPIVQGGLVHVVDPRGVLQVFDEKTGQLRWTTRVTPGLYVLAEPVVAADGSVYTVGMDGVVRGMKAPNQPHLLP